MTRKEALETAIKEATSQCKLARGLGVSQSQVWYWLWHSKKGVPAQHAPKIEELTGGKVKRHDLRPDVFAADTTA
ncbi:helix-turn-helix domain-containing protein [Terrihabitans rhizophilus]|uniref:Helix-turn-helix domain-containing protein n=1 Tax=Terrihabitans rhizophilus TaxID=3092662 RepID=A0ABU4RNB6_9HYPH|nr:helix-turn-helix domain-containing protein [Terrihabitans sp. PJ23]MDX6806337.1 helix-turn-helix domain-containing protein [Terrihabitans sp. PJ23]